MIKYLIFNNFLKKKDFNILNSIKIKKISDDEICVNQNRIYKNGNTELTCLTKKYVKNLHKNYFNKGVQILKKLNPKKVKLIDYCKFDIIETGKNYKFTIHDDQPETLLSGVIYLRPEKNIGTIFYNNKKGERKKIVNWKQNKGVFFSRKESNSWHSFESDGKNNRVVLVFNLMTNNVRAVCKIEKVNYFKAQLRNKINPLLYRFFNLTI